MTAVHQASASASASSEDNVGVKTSMECTLGK